MQSAAEMKENVTVLPAVNDPALSLNAVRSSLKYKYSVPLHWAVKTVLPPPVPNWTVRWQRVQNCTCVGVY